jgi:hypothetical protein
VIETGRSWILNCGTYRRRESWDPLNPDNGIPDLHNQMGADGLYPGQIKPPPDHSDVDPMEQENADLQYYISAEPECDT